MKNSKFNSIIKLNTSHYAIFNTLTEKYFLFEDKDYKDLTSVLSSSFFSDTFSEKKNIFYDKCISNNFIIDDNDDELLDYTKKEKEYNDNTKFNITLYNNEHNSNSFTFWVNLTNKISNLVQKVSKEYKKLEICWLFTGEYTNFKFLSILTDRFESICKRNNCCYSASLLINDIFPEHLETLLNKLVIDNIEIDVTSCSKEVTDNISKNINLIFEIKNHVEMKLIINLYDDDVYNINNLLKQIKYEYRKNINILFLNHLKFSTEIFLYRMYLTSINLGYKFSYLDKYSSLVSSFKSNSYCIDSDLNIASCVAAAKANDFFAKLEGDGEINIYNKPLYLRYLNTSTLDNYKCTCCPELPICLANYPYYRVNSRFLCIKELYDDLTLEQKIKLKILSDIVETKTLPQII